jgi:hypothetical protein
MAGASLRGFARDAAPFFPGLQAARTPRLVLRACRNV